MIMGVRPYWTVPRSATPVRFLLAPYPIAHDADVCLDLFDAGQQARPSLLRPKVLFLNALKSCHRCRAASAPSAR